MEPVKQLRAFRDEYLGVDSADLEMVEGAVTLRELPLVGDGLVFALFLGGDVQIEGDRHAAHMRGSGAPEMQAHNFGLQLEFGNERRRIRRWLTHAGGGNDAVHAEVLHHLSVVVGGVGKTEDGHSQASVER